jgi:hypothetical protein
MKDTFAHGLAFGAAIGACGFAIGFIVIGAIIDFPAAQKDPQALATCLKLHPERYCRITYDGLTP